MKLQLELQMRIVTEDEQEVTDSYICARTPPLEYGTGSFKILQNKESLLYKMFLSISEEPPFCNDFYKVKQ